MTDTQSQLDTAKEWLQETLLEHGKDIRDHHGDYISTQSLKKLYPPPTGLNPAEVSKAAKALSEVRVTNWGSWKYVGRRKGWVWEEASSATSGQPDKGPMLYHSYLAFAKAA